MGDPLLDRFQEFLDRASALGELGWVEQENGPTDGLGDHSRCPVADRSSDGVGLVIAVVGVERHGEC